MIVPGACFIPRAPAEVGGCPDSNVCQAFNETNWPLDPSVSYEGDDGPVIGYSDEFNVHYISNCPLVDPPATISFTINYTYSLA